jgi:hypothetical protein
VFAGARTQLFNPADIENVRKIQAGYRAMPLSKFLNKPAPPPAPPDRMAEDRQEARGLRSLHLLDLRPPVRPRAATGVAIACRDRKVINFQSDGCGAYSVQAFWTQARDIAMPQ